MAEEPLEKLGFGKISFTRVLMCACVCMWIIDLLFVCVGDGVTTGIHCPSIMYMLLGSGVCLFSFWFHCFQARLQSTTELKTRWVWETRRCVGELETVSHSLTYSLAHSMAHSLTHGSLNSLLTRSLTHSLTQFTSFVFLYFTYPLTQSLSWSAVYASALSVPCILSVAVGLCRWIRR